MALTMDLAENNSETFFVSYTLRFGKNLSAKFRR